MCTLMVVEVGIIGSNLEEVHVVSFYLFISLEVHAFASLSLKEVHVFASLSLLGVMFSRCYIPGYDLRCVSL